MRRTFVWDPETHKMIPKEQATHLRRPERRAVNVIGDMAEAMSVIDGKVYSSRRHYRDHVKAHGCEIVGNDWNNEPMARQAPEVPGLAEDIKRAMEGN